LLSEAKHSVIKVVRFLMDCFPLQVRFVFEPDVATV